MEDPRFQKCPSAFPLPSRHRRARFRKIRLYRLPRGTRMGHLFKGCSRSGGELESGHLPSGLYGKFLWSVSWRDHPGSGSGSRYQGRSIFKDYGCRGCHLVKGKERTMVGPPLDRMSQRVKPDWLYRWVLNPKGYLPRTKMPNPKFSSQQAADVATFLFQGGNPLEPKVGRVHRRRQKIVPGLPLYHLPFHRR